MTTTTLSQPQRESLINILTLGMYSDGHLSISEDDFLTEFLASLPWESGIAQSIFLTDSITRAANISSDVELGDYIVANAAVFNTPESRQIATDSLNRFLSADGIAGDEESFLSKVAGALKA